MSTGDLHPLDIETSTADDEHLSLSLSLSTTSMNKEFREVLQETSGDISNGPREEDSDVEEFCTPSARLDRALSSGPFLSDVDKTSLSQPRSPCEAASTARVVHSPSTQHQVGPARPLKHWSSSRNHAQGYSEALPWPAPPRNDSGGVVSSTNNAEDASVNLNLSTYLASPLPWPASRSTLRFRDRDL